MSVNIRDYVSNDHIESIGEIARGQSAIIQALSLDNSDLERQNGKLQEEIERLNNDYLEMKDNFRTANDEIERLNSAMRLKMDKILTFITDFCESCSSHEECPEEECVLWMVEQVVLEEIGKGLEEDGRE